MHVPPGLHGRRAELRRAPRYAAPRIAWFVADATYPVSLCKSKGLCQFDNSDGLNARRIWPESRNCAELFHTIEMKRTALCFPCNVLGTCCAQRSSVLKQAPWRWQQQEMKKFTLLPWQQHCRDARR